MGKFDVPANIEYITKATGKKPAYIGHSQGTTQFFVANALDHSLHEKIQAFVGVAPVAHVGNQQSALLTTLSKLYLPELIGGGWKNVLFFPLFFKDIGTYFLHLVPRTVWSVVQGVVGYDKTTHINLAQLPIMGRNDVGGTSAKNMEHWMQNVRSDDFKQYDYGSEENQKRYGQSTPPAYDIAAFSEVLKDFPMYMAVGKNDDLSALKDVEILEKVMPDSATFEFFDDWNHLDYMWATDAAKRLYNPRVIPFLKKACGVEET